VTHIKIAARGTAKKITGRRDDRHTASFAEHTNRSFRLSTDARVSRVSIKWLRFSIEDVMMMCGHKTCRGRTEGIRTRKKRAQWRGGIGGKLFVLKLGKIS
jgi:hypothetical protein